MESLVKDSNQKKILVITPRPVGFFSLVLQVLGNVEWCERSDYIPIVRFCDETCLYWRQEGYRGFTNAWEYYFEPVAKLGNKNIDFQPNNVIIHNGYNPVEGYGIGFVDGTSKWNDQPPRFYRVFVNRLMEKYIHVKSYIETQVNDFYLKNMEGKNICGVHVRTTDSNDDLDKRPPLLREYLEEVTLYIKYAELLANDQDVKVFLATDDATVFEEFKDKFGEKLLCCDFTRSLDGTALHLAPDINKPKAGEEVLIEALLLAKCDFLIHSRSNVSSFALYKNPSLDHSYITPRTPLNPMTQKMYRYLHKLFKVKLY